MIYETLQKISRINRQSVVILGDIILDHYQWGEVNRISPEAPVPVVKVVKETYSLGGAANVARNIKAMGAEPVLVGAVGRDEHGEKIRQLLSKEDISYSLLTTERKTTIKTRVMGNAQQIVRVDMESSLPLTRKEFSRLQDTFLSAPLSRHIVVSDYGKGLINKHSLGMLKDRKTLIDPKTVNFSRYHGVFIMTPNKNEAQEGSGVIIQNKKDIIRAGKAIIRKNRAANLLITLGPDGMVLFLDSGEIVHITTCARKVFDVTGAGDTVIGVLAACLEADIDLVTGCILANFAAGIVVGQLGTASATKEEVEKVIEKFNLPETERWE